MSADDVRRLELVGIAAWRAADELREARDAEERRQRGATA